MSNINDDTIPVLSRDIIAREDKKGMLLFQVYTDEMYFIPLAAYRDVVLKCNGSQTLGEIIGEASLNAAAPSPKEKVYQFMEELLNRKIISIW